MREIFHIFKPAQLAEWKAQPHTLRRRLAEAMPPLPTVHLRDCQINAVTGLEQSQVLNNRELKSWNKGEEKWLEDNVKHWLMIW